MKYCMDYTALLSSLLDDALTPAETKQVQTHLASCPGCRAYYEDLRAIRASFADLEDVEVPAGFTASVMSAVRADAANPVDTAASTRAATAKKHSVWKVLASAAACLVLVAALGGTDLLPWQGSSADSTADVASADAYSLAPAAETSPGDTGGEVASPKDAAASASEEKTANHQVTATAEEPQVIESLPPVQSDHAAPESSTTSGTAIYFATLSLTQAEAGNLLAELQPAEQTEEALSYTLSRTEYDQLLIELQEKGVTVETASPRISVALTLEPAEDGVAELALVTIALSDKN